MLFHTPPAPIKEVALLVLPTTIQQVCTHHDQLALHSQDARMSRTCLRCRIAVTINSLLLVGAGQWAHAVAHMRRQLQHLAGGALPLAGRHASSACRGRLRSQLVQQVWAGCRGCACVPVCCRAASGQTRARSAYSMFDGDWCCTCWPSMTSAYAGGASICMLS